MSDVDAGATESTIEAAENRLRQRFPDDYGTFSVQISSPTSESRPVSG
jgi:hypothetical protein